MRGDSDDEKFARYAMAGALIWFVLLLTGVLTSTWVLVAYCGGFASSLALLALTLYKDWWPIR